MRLTEDVSFKNNKADYILAFAASIQSFLVIMQAYMIDVLYMPAEATTKYRVAFTALPIIIAFAIIAYRRLSWVFASYFIVSLLLCWSIIITPDVKPVILNEGFRFLLPVVIPTFLCCVSIRKLEVFEKVMYYVSCLTGCLALLYVANFFMGRFIIENYNMSFSYGLLIPIIVFYSKGDTINKIIAVFLMVVITAIGSRGAVYISVLYIFIYHLINGDKAAVYKLLVLAAIGFILLESSLLADLNSLFNRYGIESRTLGLVLSGQGDFDSGRDVIYHRAISLIFSSPLIGYGMYSDRVLLQLTYVHNIILEIFMNFGVVMGMLILVFIIAKSVMLFSKLNTEYRLVLLKYSIATIAPLMTSHSYLNSYSFAMFLGLLVLLKKTRKIVSEPA